MILVTGLQNGRGGGAFNNVLASWLWGKLGHTYDSFETVHNSPAHSRNLAQAAEDGSVPADARQVQQLSNEYSLV
jgi:hypothetical protein